MNRTAVVAGLLYVVLGLLFLLERLGAIVLSARFVWPTVLIAIGIAVLLGGRGRPRGEPEFMPPEPAPERPPPGTDAPPEEDRRERRSDLWSDDPPRPGA